MPHFSLEKRGPTRKKRSKKTPVPNSHLSVQSGATLLKLNAQPTTVNAEKHSRIMTHLSYRISWSLSVDHTGTTVFCILCSNLDQDPAYYVAATGGRLLTGHPAHPARQPKAEREVAWRPSGHCPCKCRCGHHSGGA